MLISHQRTTLVLAGIFALSTLCSCQSNAISPNQIPSENLLPSSNDSDANGSGNSSNGDSENTPPDPALSIENCIKFNLAECLPLTTSFPQQVFLGSTVSVRFQGAPFDLKDQPITFFLAANSELTNPNDPGEDFPEKFLPIETTLADGPGLSGLFTLSAQSLGGYTFAAGLGQQNDDTGEETLYFSPYKTVHVLPVAAGSVLEPGNGFTAPLNDNMSPIGSGPGVDAKAFAAFNVVPRQDVNGIFEVGVIAFHINGIERVEISLEGGPPVVLTEMTLNPRSQTAEYWAYLDPKAFSKAKSVELRATAYAAVAGTPREIGPLYLNVFPSGFIPTPVRYVSLSGDDDQNNGLTAAQPKKTIGGAVDSIQLARGHVNGGVIKLAAGTHFLQRRKVVAPINTTRWLTIEPDTDVDPSQVILVQNPNPIIDTVNGITEYAGLGVHLLRLHRITAREQVLAGSFGASDKKVWADQTEYIGKGQTVDLDGGENNGWLFEFSERYLTNAVIRENEICAKNSTIARATSCIDIGSEGFGNSKLVVNSSIDNVFRGENSWHPDVYQFDGGDMRDNVIVYNFKATNAEAQGIFVKDVKDFVNAAFVNVLIEGSAKFKSQFYVPTNHFLLWNVTLQNQPVRWRVGLHKLKNLSVKGCVFEWMDWVDPATSEWENTGQYESWFSQNHYEIDSGFHKITPGTEVTTGAVNWANESADNFRPTITSPVKDVNLAPAFSPPVPVDLNNNFRGNISSKGALE